jgi:hypothetical protein
VHARAEDVEQRAADDRDRRHLRCDADPLQRRTPVVGPRVGEVAERLDDHHGGERAERQRVQAPAVDAGGEHPADGVGQQADPWHVPEHEEQGDVTTERGVGGGAVRGVDDLAEVVEDRLVQRADQRAQAGEQRERIAAA